MLGKGSTWLSSCREIESSRTEQLQFTKAYNTYTCGGMLISPGGLKVKIIFLFLFFRGSE